MQAQPTVPARLHAAAVDAAARAAAFLETVPEDAAGSTTQSLPPPPPSPPLRPGWLPLGDVLVAPIALVLAAATARVVPFVLFVPLLPLLFGTALYSCAIIAAGVTPTRLPESRVVASAVVTVAGAGAGALLLIHVRWLPLTATLAQTALFAAFFSLYALTAFGNPGIVPRGGGDPRTTHHGGTCGVCGCVKPLRSRHCRACGVCVRRFDHHCPAVGVCVGEGNQRAFTALVCVAAVGQACYAATAATALRTAHAPPGASFWAAATAATAASPGCVMLAVFMAKLAVGSAFLAGRALRNAARNVTVAEAARPRRHPYLQPSSSDGSTATTTRLDNLLDRGVAANCSQFWGGERSVDWSAAVDDALVARRGGGRPGDAELVPLAPLGVERV